MEDTQASEGQLCWLILLFICISKACNYLQMNFKETKYQCLLDFFISYFNKCFKHEKYLVLLIVFSFSLKKSI